MSSSKPKKTPQVVNMTPSEVKARAKQFFYTLMDEGKCPWPTKFFNLKQFTRKRCESCKKYYWTLNPEQCNCGDSSCAGGYSFLHPDKPPQKRLTYLQAWLDFKQSLETTPVPHTAIDRYPVVARWRSDVDFVAAGIYCFQPFCVTGESDPPANPLIAAQLCLRFNDLDNIGITGRHYSGFHMLGIQVFNHEAKRHSEPQEPYDETEEIFWKDSCIANCFRWVTETLHLDPKAVTFIEDVWQGGGNCGACVEFFAGGLEIGNMVFMEYSITPACEFIPLETKVIDVGIGLERIPWLYNGSWTSYVDVFDYILPYLSEKTGAAIDNEEFWKFAPNTALFDVDENKDIEGTWNRIANEMGLDKEGLAQFQKRLREFSHLVIICDHTRSILYAVEDGALPSNVGGGGNIRTILRRAFSILEEHKWFDKIGGVEGFIYLFKLHMEGLKGFVSEFKNVRCLEDVIRIEFKRWKEGKESAKRAFKPRIEKFKGKPIPTEEWIFAMSSLGLTAEEISEAIKEYLGLSGDIPADLHLKLEESRIRTAKGVALAPYDVSGIEGTIELFNEPEYERVYDLKATITHVLGVNQFVCNQSIMYPTGGGQDHDEGHIIIGDNKYEITNIEKVRNVVVFSIKENVDVSFVGKECIQVVDPNVREILRSHHTATHVVAAAAREVLGPHVWQNGACKTKSGAHIDLTHYELPTYEQMLAIDAAANRIVMRGAKVNKGIFTRKEAESKWGFVLYQGGAIPGNAIRVVDIEGIDTEACCGTHVDNVNEIGAIKIVRHTKVSDGVFRIEFVAGPLAVKAHHADMRIIRSLLELYGGSPEEIMFNANKFFDERNQYMGQNKKLTDQILYLEVTNGASLGKNAFIIRKTDENGSAYIKGIETAVSKQPLMNDKSVIVMGPTYFYGIIQKSLFDQIKPQLERCLQDNSSKYRVVISPNEFQILTTGNPKGKCLEEYNTDDSEAEVQKIMQACKSLDIQLDGQQFVTPIDKEISKRIKNISHPTCQPLKIDVMKNKPIVGMGSMKVIPEALPSVEAILKSMGFVE